MLLRRILLTHAARARVARRCAVGFSSAYNDAHTAQELPPHTFTCRFKFNPKSKQVLKTLQKDPRPQHATGPTVEDAAPAAAAATPDAAAPANKADAEPAAKKQRFDAKKSHELLEQEVTTLKNQVSTLTDELSNLKGGLARVASELSAVTSRGL